MDEPNNNVGRYRFDIAYEKPPQDVEHRRIDALRSWLSKQFETRQKEVSHDESKAG